MHSEARQNYNQHFSEEKYQTFLAKLNARFHKKIDFRVAETPIFIPKSFKSRLIAASEDVLKVICADNFKALTANSIPSKENVPNEDNHPTFLTIDFAVCKDESGEFIPQLIEMQGFPSLYGFQDMVSHEFREVFGIQDNFSHLFDDLDSDKYFDIISKVILGSHKPENVVLLEIEPHRQKTWVDFYYTREKIGIEPICISEVIREGNKLYYFHNGQKLPIHRIYNRVIFDELEKRSDLERKFNLTEPVEVEWAGHPNWFFRMSKYTVPFVDSIYVPKTYFLDQIPEIPQDLENYVLKPLFSFAGAGVKFDVQRADIEQIPLSERHNFILQKKVQYAEALHDNQGEPIKAEIRMMFVWERGAEKPHLVTGLGRLSKGKMIGVDFNKDKTWVGGTAVFFER
jgi:uncharacterized protein (UPF0248 family)